MRKSFDDLTIADDFMFCKVMQDKEVCKTFLEMTLAGQIGKITELSSQNAIFAGAEAKSVRLDIFVKDENGKTYNIEMQAVNEFNLPKRMRYYQAAIDILFLDRRIEKMIEQVKNTEQARSEYRFISGFEMDARHYGRLEGRAEGSYQTKLETARLMKFENLGVELISKVTGLSKAEVEKL